MLGREYCGDCELTVLALLLTPALSLYWYADISLITLHSCGTEQHQEILQTNICQEAGGRRGGGSLNCIFTRQHGSRF